jgi:serine/threonine protein kinase
VIVGIDTLSKVKVLKTSEKLRADICRESVRRRQVRRGAELRVRTPSPSGHCSGAAGPTPIPAKHEGDRTSVPRHYMWCVRRILVLVRLPLTLTHPVHHWLYFIAGILHRDLSPNNIICRYKTEGGKQEVYGVLMDFNLSSWKAALKGDYTMTSQQQTGTPPYMAQELMVGKSPTHLYRHDLESLFYVMLLTATRHSIGIPEGWMKPRLVMREAPEPKDLPFYHWFDQCNYNTLGSLKASFLLNEQPIRPSPDFQDFQEWLVDLQHCFTLGARPVVPVWYITGTLQGHGQSNSIIPIQYTAGTS